MANRNQFVIEHELSGPVIVNLEPESVHIFLASDERGPAQGRLACNFWIRTEITGSCPCHLFRSS
jgi:hypothetical protein